MAQKNRYQQFLAPMGETDLSHDILFKILSYAFRGRWGWMTSDDEILRLQPRKVAIVPESLAPHLEKVK